ncbi:AAA family ATPase [Crocosphaera sp.]|uniref:AAA family ATPase n=1 Tax=Crocosphaera sp. TaxID=2729996 RepID=UPI003F2640B9|nr:AAA family ATPase [Crocosphaera sp.]
MSTARHILALLRSHVEGEEQQFYSAALQMAAHDQGESLLIAATNHPNLLDKALLRRFDDVIKYNLPDSDIIRELIQTRLISFDIDWKDWSKIIEKATGLAQAEIVRATDEAAKQAVLSNSGKVSEKSLISAIMERKEMTLNE